MRLALSITAAAIAVSNWPATAWCIGFCAGCLVVSRVWLAITRGIDQLERPVDHDY